MTASRGWVRIQSATSPSSSSATASRAALRAVAFAGLFGVGADDRKHPPHLGIGGSGEHDPSIVAGPVDVARNASRHAAAGARRRIRDAVPRGGGQPQQAEHGLEHADVDQLPGRSADVTGVAREQRADQPGHCCQRVTEGGGRQHRRAAGLSGEMGQTGKSLGEAAVSGQVGVGARRLRNT